MSNTSWMQRLTAGSITGPDAEQAFEEAQRLQHLDRVDNDVRRAYEMALELAHEADEHDTDSESGGRWLSLTDLRAELDEQARRGGREPHTKEDIDAALQRITRDQATTVHVIPEDHEHLLTDADRQAAVRFSGVDRHMIRIDYPEYPDADANSVSDSASDRAGLVATADDNQHVTDPTCRFETARIGMDGDCAEVSIGHLLTRADEAEMNADQLADTDAQATELRANAEQWRREARQAARLNGLGDLSDDDDDTAADAVHDDGDDWVYKSADERFEDSVDALYAQEHADDDAAGDVEDPVPPYLRGRGWLGEPLTEADKAAYWRDRGPQQELPPYGNWPAPGSTQRADKDEAGSHDTAHADTDATAVLDQHTDEQNQPARRETTAIAQASDDHRATTEHADTMDSNRHAESTSDEAAAAEPVTATETIACTVAVTRARCSVDRVQQRLDAEQDAAAERDDELARWHADDTAAQADNDRARSDSAAQDSATVRE